MRTLLLLLAAASLGACTSTRLLPLPATPDEAAVSIARATMPGEVAVHASRYAPRADSLSYGPYAGLSIGERLRLGEHSVLGPSWAGLSGQDLTKAMRWEEVWALSVTRKDRSIGALKGLVGGLVAGALAGAVIGALSYENSGGDALVFENRGQAVAVWTAVLGTTGGLFGAAFGLMAGDVRRTVWVRNR